ncbi:heme oxygenase-like protein [Pseudovirgaria hyperparasitica]|uniref:Heme oxygenase-like protein n=1 Tax=Pseudovirgaria hyperparasitica TaxID=470096 RepID=A0A6A6VZY8_9PEZI|nr:heme oxygenase-like protein [Pseudovirgaria hyperparasitica]KAF2755459.1 heme oxygenase-like protein [Pseudovirgaria hyperparasitica]
MGRHANPDIRRAYEEFHDSDTPSKCNKVRCRHCGYVRAKNTTRQIEHLQECQSYLQSPEALAHLATINPTNSNGGTEIPTRPPGPGILNGTHPNPNLHVNRRGPNQNKRNRDSLMMQSGLSQQHTQPSAGPPQPSPSLTSHLLASYQSEFTSATQQPFLSHAGCGTLAAAPLNQWLVQDGHYARGYIRFIGQLLAKIRLPQVQNSQFHPMYRTMDLLISALNNIRREMSFFEITVSKYGLQVTDTPPNHITRAYLDLFVSASSSSASLLEGMIVLWGTEHCYRTAWMYAANFSHSLSTPSTETHVVALHQAFIPNWTSPAFAKFVEATRGLADELANATVSNGKEEMLRCEEVFKQICWLAERFWPDVDGMGEEDESGRLGAGLGGGIGGLGSADSEEQDQPGNYGALNGMTDEVNAES